MKPWTNESWQSESKHATSRLHRFSTILNSWFCEGESFLNRNTSAEDGPVILFDVTVKQHSPLHHVHHGHRFMLLCVFFRDRRCFQHNRFLSHVVFQTRSWFLKRETMPLDFLATKNQASVWKNAEDMMIQRSFYIMYDTYNDVVKRYCVSIPSLASLDTEDMWLVK